ncbi:ACT domain-containing protein [Salipiger sp. H15]|uniref:ACT domain-containing protein n=1 Tax=Alloyangia sp. H15 TaxID=3029062 RepID=A0AAU8AD57_9RHOB
MPKVVASASEMIAGMSPEKRPGRFAYFSTEDPALGEALIRDALCLFREREGLSLILPLEIVERVLADRPAQAVPQIVPMCCITLNVYSSLEGVGLTAAVSGALAAQGIPCNMVAACHHDHVFVPEEHCDAALRVLAGLQEGSGA